MTKANITVNGESFHVRSDGMDGKEIKEYIQGYIDEGKKKLKNPANIAEFVIDRMSRNANDYYEWIQVGDTGYSSHDYTANIDNKGNLKFEETVKK